MGFLSRRGNPFNGALDIIIVKRENGSFTSSGWYLHRRLFSADVKQNSVIEIAIGNHHVDRFHMYFRQLCTKDKNGVSMYSPKSDELKLISQRLREGRNDIKFYLRDQPDSSITARIFLWKWNSKIVCTDVDGTMTRSDIRGILCCYTGINWMRRGVAGLFSDIKGEGYKFVYVTARPISMIESTKKYLAKHEDQEDGKKLPDGPVITSCHGRIHTAARHAIFTHAAFKTPCLQQIRNLFHENPFYAGFGDRKSDLKSYRAVDIPDNRSFLIKKRGAVVIYKNKKRSVTYGSYKDLGYCINMFPKVNTSSSRARFKRLHQDSDSESIRAEFPRVY